MGAVHCAHRWKGRLRPLNGTLRGVSTLEGSGIGEKGCVQEFYQTSVYQGVSQPARKWPVFCRTCSECARFFSARRTTQRMWGFLGTQNPSRCRPEETRGTCAHDHIL